MRHPGPSRIETDGSGSPDNTGAPEDRRYYSHRNGRQPQSGGTRWGLDTTCSFAGPVR